LASLRENLDSILQRIAAAARAAGRGPEEVGLLAVTKSVTVETAAALARLGVEDLGESRAPELERKVEALAALGLEPHWHFIGHLQSNKVRRVVRLARSLHSIDSLELLERTAAIALEEERRPDVYLQVHLSGEVEKFGLDPSDLTDVARAAVALASVRLRGLMTMAPLETRLGTSRSAGEVFADLQYLGRELEQDPGVGEHLLDRRCALSMGMSGDFEQAIACGAHLVRVGQALFEGLDGPDGARPPARSGEAGQAEAVPSTRPRRPAEEQRG
jgi:pyridoxal phosphate enzyme (YggS family)